MKTKIGAIATAIAVLAIAAPTANAATLSQRVAKLEARLACLQYTGLSEWSGYMALDSTEVTAASFDQAQGYPASAGDYRVLVVKPTSTCRAKFTAAPNRYAFTASSARGTSSAMAAKLHLERVIGG